MAWPRTVSVPALPVRPARWRPDCAPCGGTVVPALPGVVPSSETAVFLLEPAFTPGVAPKLADALAATAVPLYVAALSPSLGRRLEERQSRRGTGITNKSARGHTRPVHGYDLGSKEG